ncbi:MAG: hypothetical protein RIG82_06605 [Phycisphaeraceae bacterium]
MTSERLLHLHQASPFRHFIIHLADRRALGVDHPELLTYQRNSRTAVVYASDSSAHTIDLLLVTGLEVLLA